MIWWRIERHPDPDSENMELRDNHQLGGKERDAAHDHPESAVHHRSLLASNPARELQL